MGNFANMSQFSILRAAGADIEAQRKKDVAKTIECQAGQRFISRRLLCERDLPLWWEAE